MANEKEAMVEDKTITIGVPRYKKLERIEERYTLLLSTWEKFMDAEGRRKELPEEMTKQKYPRLNVRELAKFMRSDHCKGMFPDEVLVELERVGK